MEATHGPLPGRPACAFSCVEIFSRKIYRYYAADDDVSDIGTSDVIVVYRQAVPPGGALAPGRVAVVFQALADPRAFAEGTRPRVEQFPDMSRSIG